MRCELQEWDPSAALICRTAWWNVGAKEIGLRGFCRVASGPGIVRAGAEFERCVMLRELWVCYVVVVLVYYLIDGWFYMVLGLAEMLLCPGTRAGADLHVPGGWYTHQHRPLPVRLLYTSKLKWQKTFSERRFNNWTGDTLHKRQGHMAGLVTIEVGLEKEGTVIFTSVLLNVKEN